MTAVNLSDDLVELARKHAKVYERSVAKQIEHWAKVGYVASNNKDMSYNDVIDLMMKEMK